MFLCFAYDILCNVLSQVTRGQIGKGEIIIFLPLLVIFLRLSSCGIGQFCVDQFSFSV